MEKGIKPWDNYWRNLGKETQQPHKEILDAVEKSTTLKGKKVLEMGAGSGLTSLALSQKGAFVIAADLSQDAIRLIIENTKKSNVKIVQADVFNVPFKDNSFDVVFHQGLIEHFKNPEKILKEQIRILKNKGLFLVEVPQKFSTYTLMKHRLIKRGEWYGGWETQYSIFKLKRMLKSINDYKIKIISSFGYGTWGILTRIRYLHYRGNVRFGRPILPKFLFDLYEIIWKRIEGSPLMKLIAVNICVLGMKE